MQGVPLFNDDIEAWRYGPTVRDIYSSYAHKGTMTLTKEDTQHFEYNPETNNVEITKKSMNGLKIDNKTTTIIDQVINNTKGISDFTLCEITYNQEPWIKSYHPERKTNIIEKRVISNFFIDL